MIVRSAIKIRKSKQKALYGAKLTTVLSLEQDGNSIQKCDLVEIVFFTSV